MIPPGYVSIRSAYTKVSQLNDLDAVGRLTFYLSTGKLQAFDFGKRGEKQLIRAEFWQNIPEGIRRDVFQKGPGSMTQRRRRRDRSPGISQPRPGHRAAHAGN
jgi:hypothetical protein